MNWWNGRSTWPERSAVHALCFSTHFISYCLPTTKERSWVGTFWIFLSANEICNKNTADFLIVFTSAWHYLKCFMYNISVNPHKGIKSYGI